jgi:hypothetical protein
MRYKYHSGGLAKQTWICIIPDKSRRQKITAFSITVAVVPLFHMVLVVVRGF